MRTGTLHREEVVRAVVTALPVLAAVVALPSAKEPLTPLLNFLQLSLLDLQMVLLFFLFFFVLVRLVGSTVFAPVLKLIEERERATEGAQRRARELRERRAQLESEIDHTLTDVRGTALRDRAQRLQVAKSEGQKILGEWETQVAGLMADERQKLDRDMEGLKGELSQKSEELADLLVGRILPR